ncbi:hypothetical protein DUI87_07640 [Hirundo rustica rustica]|uniref:Uncharacterized protein n=1 Tax=Hirundo rustica rustica TaxID=333673 RepID=A0A3M0KQ96_HIRRU|nr:hypothetical protein DUI87_07640 [Hirundo rustica rustica]
MLGARSSLFSPDAICWLKRQEYFNIEAQVVIFMVFRRATEDEPLRCCQETAEVIQCSEQGPSCVSAKMIPFGDTSQVILSVYPGTSPHLGETAKPEATITILKLCVCS